MAIPATIARRKMDKERGRRTAAAFPPLKFASTAHVPSYDRFAAEMFLPMPSIARLAGFAYAAASFEEISTIDSVLQGIESRSEHRQHASGESFDGILEIPVESWIRKVLPFGIKLVRDAHAVRNIDVWPMTSCSRSGDDPGS
ncbi:hypothetical protein AC578_2638 [Pseudocercospora eumusae]|uniref:Uncharacterized protein n=1 Tax=Pseudocercospora eumusae TaxID=321146 RepID=A0A139H0A7_9PEZI|nr:hypothetical protein AC578_2638 [Pseudocercospora eumusae]